MDSSTILHIDVPREGWFPGTGKEFVKLILRERPTALRGSIIYRGCSFLISNYVNFDQFNGIVSKSGGRAWKLNGAISKLGVCICIFSVDEILWKQVRRLAG